MKQIIRVLCERKSDGKMKYLEDEYQDVTLEFDSVVNAQKKANHMNDGNNQWKYTVVVEHVPPVPKWRWAVQYSSLLTPGTVFGPKITEEYYSSEQELRDDNKPFNILWAQKLDKTERRG